MLTFIGDSLNALAMGALFPLALMPLARLLAHRFAAREPHGEPRGEPHGEPGTDNGSQRLPALAVWTAMIAVTAISIWLFAYLAVDLKAPHPGIGPHLVGLAVIALVSFFSLRTNFAVVTDRLAALAHTIAAVTGRIALVFVLVMTAIQFAVVVMRYVFGVNFILLQESVTYFHGGAFLLAGGYALLTDDHVRVDILYTNFTDRQKAQINLAGIYLFLIPFAFVTMLLANDYVADAWAVKEGSTEQSGIQGIYLLKTLIPAFAVLLFCAGLALANRATRVLRADRQMPAHPSDRREG